MAFCHRATEFASPHQFGYEKFSKHPCAVTSNSGERNAVFDPQFINRTEYFAAMHHHNDQFRPRIFAIDEPESTVYVLVQNGTATHMADWPHPLRQLCPEATDGGTLSNTGCCLLPGREVDVVNDLMAVVDGWVREPGFSPLSNNRDCDKVG